MEQDNVEIILQLPQDIHKLCRICLCASNDELLSHEIIIFNEFNNLTEIAEMIQLCSTIKINPLEGLPMSICEECLSKLQITYDFIQQCKNSDIMLKKILNITSSDKSLEPLQNAPTTTPKNNQSLSFYENFKPESSKNFDQIDLGIFFEQRHTLVNKYLNNPNSTISKDGNEDDISKLINNRKEYKDIANQEYETNFFIKLESDERCDDNFNCDVCNKVFDSEDSLNHHQVECTTQTSIVNLDNIPTKQTVKRRNKISYNFSCDLCFKSFSNASKLALHFYNHAKKISEEKMGNAETGNPAPMCHLCLETFESVIILEDHIKTHNSFACKICSEDFLNESYLIFHLKKHGIQVPFCNICSKRFDSLSSLKMHHIMHVTDKTKSVFACPICQEEFTSIDLLRDHSLTHLNEFYKCDKCVQTFNNVISYKHHIQQHLEPKHLCSICGKAYFSRSTLQCHLLSHNNEKPFVCNVCSKAFSSRATLSVHRRIHSDFKPYICSYCGYSCRQSGDLAMHIRTHTGDKPYECTFPNCGRKFTTCSQRREHYRRHTNERNHKCQECGKAFLETKTLKVHMLTHTGEKPHECNTCGKKFRRIHHLTYHMKSHVSTSTSTITNSKPTNRKKIESVTVDWAEKNTDINLVHESEFNNH